MGPGRKEEIEIQVYNLQGAFLKFFWVMLLKLKKNEIVM